MRMSGFSFVKNATKLYLPLKESIESILPIVDEFIIAVGDCDPDDQTLKEIEDIGSKKLRIVNTVWDYEKFPNGTEYAHQTDIAKEHCTGDWLFYIQGDEVIHENDHQIIRNRCSELLDNDQVEGLLFKYFHFYGDYWHYQQTHGWYKEEIRIIRNDPNIHSWRDAQSFRRIPGFDGRNYRQERGTYKLKVAKVNASVYHYGWVRPPCFFKRKKEERKDNYKNQSIDVSDVNFGPLGYLAEFKGSHPMFMKRWLDRFDWADQLNYSKVISKQDKQIKHCRLKNRILTYLEQNYFDGKTIGANNNYQLLNV